MKAHVGDRIVVAADKVGHPARAGVVEEVLNKEPPRLRVRWDTGQTSIVSPSSGAAQLESPHAAHHRAS